jgi:hypothetical protein
MPGTISQCLPPKLESLGMIDALSDKFVKDLLERRDLQFDGENLQ